MESVLLLPAANKNTHNSVFNKPLKPDLPDALPAVYLTVI